MWKYSRHEVEGLSLTTAKSEFNLWGTNVYLSLTTYSVHVSDYPETGLSFSFGPVGKSASLIPVNIQTDGVWRTVQQAINVPFITGTILDLSDLSIDEDVHCARTICNATLRTLAAAIEHTRLDVRKGISKNVASRVLSNLSQYYPTPWLNKMLPEINWAFMLQNSGCPQRALDVIDTTFRNNQIRRFDITHDGATDIPRFITERFVVDRRSLADLKAASLLRHVCGIDAYEEFKEKGYITVSNEGYTFQLAPGRFAKVTDPFGDTAELCIHTFGFSCNYIDEIVLAQQYIKHQFNWYMKTAIVHVPKGNFRMPWQLTSTKC